MFKVNNYKQERRHQLWTYSTPISSVSVANFVKVNVSWVTGSAIYLFVFSFNKFTSLFVRDQPITARCSLFIPPDNIRNPMVFWCFQWSGGGGGGIKRDLWVVRISSLEFSLMYYHYCLKIVSHYHFACFRLWTEQGNAWADWCF